MIICPGILQKIIHYFDVLANRSFMTIRYYTWVNIITIINYLITSVTCKTDYVIKRVFSWFDERLLGYNISGISINHRYLLYQTESFIFKINQHNSCFIAIPVIFRNFDVSLYNLHIYYAIYSVYSVKFLFNFLNSNG